MQLAETKKTKIENSRNILPDSMVGQDLLILSQDLTSVRKFLGYYNKNNSDKQASDLIDQIISPSSLEYVINRMKAVSNKIQDTDESLEIISNIEESEQKIMQIVATFKYYTKDQILPATTEIKRLIETINDCLNNLTYQTEELKSENLTAQEMINILFNQQFGKCKILEFKPGKDEISLLSKKQIQNQLLYFIELLKKADTPTQILNWQLTHNADTDVKNSLNMERLQGNIYSIRLSLGDRLYFKILEDQTTIEIIQIGGHW